MLATDGGITTSAAWPAKASPHRDAGMAVMDVASELDDLLEHLTLSDEMAVLDELHIGKAAYAHALAQRTTRPRSASGRTGAANKSAAEDPTAVEEAIRSGRGASLVSHYDRYTDHPSEQVSSSLSCVCLTRAKELGVWAQGLFCDEYKEQLVFTILFRKLLSISMHAGLEILTDRA